MEIIAPTHVLPPCPVWCRRDHSGEQVEVDGFLLGTVHDQVLAELPAGDPATYRDPATATVLVERSDEDGAVISPARVVLTVAEGPEGAYVGGEGVQGWTGSVEQARALAAALLAAAELVEGGAR
ncbi:DUF6907 domain-containing protein [Micromonospora sp. IBHARD004]|uniref:DUF6907 domain-containing protein n=1 Tax=Micromonospora sp. IBHARD004 TaxID=3457764 RepID=UPI0040583898